ncbi:MAG: thioredoxin family protein [Lutibacter sp.]
MNYFKEDSITEFNKVLQSNNAVLLYFSTLSCRVGENVEPKVRDLLQNKFNNINFYHVDLNLSPKIAAHCQVFVEPTIILYFEGKETIRKSRAFSLLELEEQISRIYQLFFE